MRPCLKEESDEHHKHIITVIHKST